MQQLRSRCRARASRCGSARYSTGDLPSMRASTGPAAGTPMRASARRRLPVRRARSRRRVSASKLAISASRMRGRCAAFSRKWFRQNARSKAGSPNQAHSASSSTGPCGPSRMFFGLTSPCTSTRRVAAVRSTSASRVGQRRVHARRLHQVGLQPQRVEVRVGGETPRQRRIVRSRGVDAAEHVADATARSARRRAGQQLAPSSCGSPARGTP